MPRTIRRSPPSSVLLRLTPTDVRHPLSDLRRDLRQGVLVELGVRLTPEQLERAAGLAEEDLIDLYRGRAMSWR